MKCFYHRDMDGKCAGAIVYNLPILMQDGVTLDYKEMIDIDYKDTLDLKTILPNEKIWIVDFSFKPEVMEEILKITQDITWIDHHKTALEYKYSKGLAGIRKDGIAGCVLTWQFCYPNKKVPVLIDMLGAYDIWDFSIFGDNLNKLQSGIRLFNTNPDGEKWKEWLQDESIISLTELLDKGSIALQFRTDRYASLIKAWSFWTEFEGYKAICCNVGSTSSQLFDSVKEDYDLMIPFVFDGKQWTVSLYTKKDIDCSEIAKKYGGGGHKQAAGFQCEELPFKL